MASLNQNNLEKASSDFLRVRELDPKNVEAQREIASIECIKNSRLSFVTNPSIVVGKNGERTNSCLESNGGVLGIYDSGDDSKGVHLMDVDIQSTCERERSSSCKDVTEVELCGGEKDTDIPMLGVKDDQFVNFATNPSSVHNPQSPSCRFVNKHNRHHSLSLPTKSLEGRSHGKELQFYHSHTMTFMRVRILNHKTSVFNGAHHDISSREAEAPCTGNLENAGAFDEDFSVECQDSEEGCFQSEKRQRIDYDHGFTFKASPKDESKMCLRYLKKFAHSRNSVEVLMSLTTLLPRI